MVKITNGLITCEVTNGAYNSIYKFQGYHPVDGAAKAAEHAEPPANEPLADPFAELVEKPLSQWSKAEVKKFADAKGIDLSGTKNVNEAKDRIKAFLEDGTAEVEPGGDGSEE